MFLFVFTNQFYFLFVFGNGKERRRTPLLGWRKQHRELHGEEISPHLVGGRVHLAVTPSEEELISQTGEGDWISR